MEEFKVVGARDSACWVTKGKVYESKNGVITFDNGAKSIRYSCAEDFLNFDNALENKLFKEYKEQEEKQHNGRTTLKKRLDEIESRLSALENQDRQENQNKSDDVERLSKVNSNLVKQNESLICKIHQMEKEIDELETRNIELSSLTDNLRSKRNLLEVKVNTLKRQNESMGGEIQGLKSVVDAFKTSSYEDELKIKELRKLKCSRVMPEEVMFNLDLAKNLFEITNIGGERLMSYEVLLGRNVVENGKLSKQTFYLKMIKEDK